MTRTAWSKADGRKVLVELEGRVDRDGGAAITTTYELVRSVTGRKVVAAKNETEAQTMLNARRGWSQRASATRGTVYVYGGARPTARFVEDFAGRLAWATETRHIEPQGPASVRMVGVNRWRSIEGDDFFLAQWGSFVFESLGWRPTECPPDVDPLDRAWYPPAKEGAR